MAKIYYRLIKAAGSTMKIDDVPVRWKAAVQALLDADTTEASETTPTAG